MNFFPSTEWVCALSCWQLLLLRFGYTSSPHPLAHLSLTVSSLPFFPLNNCLVIMQIRAQTKRESKIEREIRGWAREYVRAHTPKYFTEFSNCRTFNVRLHESRNISPSYFLFSLKIHSLSLLRSYSHFGFLARDFFFPFPLNIYIFSVAVCLSNCSAFCRYTSLIVRCGNCRSGSSGWLAKFCLLPDVGAAFNLNFDYRIQTFNMVILLTKFYREIKWDSSHSGSNSMNGGCRWVRWIVINVRS